jgi:hypothetical protein
MTINTKTGRNVKVVRIAASLSFLRAQAIQAAITNVQAFVVAPESTAMSSQKNSEARTSTCEAINQIKMGFREGVAGLFSNAILL